MPFFVFRRLRIAASIAGSALILLSLAKPAPMLAQQLSETFSSSQIAPVESASVAPEATGLPETLPDDPGTLRFSYPAQTSSSASSSEQSAQSSDQSSPSTPTPQDSTNPDAVSPNGTQQTKRILGIMPNFRSVSADTKLPPMTPKEKFIIAGKDTFDYSSFLIAGIQAGFSMNGDSYPEFHQGAAGYARYYWHTLADTIDENFMVGGLGPIVFHQDNRFYTLGHGGFAKRSFYAWTRVLVSRKDDGDATFNYSEIIGSGAAAGVSTLYYPTRYRTWTKVGQKWLTSDLIDGANFMLKEWWPDINKKIFHTH